jgi:hypothetical protein
MPDYQRGKIYKIVCNTTGLTYYGSTCEPTLARRLAGHRTHYGMWKRGTMKKTNKITSFKVLEKGNYEIVLVEAVPCNSKMELHQRERFYIENNDCVNFITPLRTKSEYKIDNREVINEKQKIYYKSHKEEKAVYDAEYKLKNIQKLKEQAAEKYTCECGKITKRRHHNRHDLSLYHIAFMNNQTL